PYLDWLVFFWWAVLGNALGGIGITAFLLLLRSHVRVAEWRRVDPISHRPLPGSAHDSTTHTHEPAARVATHSPPAPGKNVSREMYRRFRGKLRNTRSYTWSRG